MAVTLPVPSRSDAGGGRRRGLRLPTAEDVPQIAQARDPGASVPRTSGDFSEALAGLSDRLSASAERQRKLQDATESGNAELSFSEQGMAEFNRRQTEDDPARPDYMKDYSAFLTERQEALMKSVEGKLSPEATERLRLRLAEKSLAMTDSAGRLQLAAQQTAANDLIDRKINQWSAQAQRDPAFLDVFLGLADEELADFAGALKPEQERAARQKARQTVIASTISGLVDKKQFDKAQELLDSGRFDEDLPATVREKALSGIETGRKSAMAEQRAELRLQLEDEIASIRETGRGIGVSRESVKAAFGDQAPRILKTLDDEAAFYRAKSTVSLNTPEEDAALVARLTPQGDGFKVEAERRDMVVKAIEDKRKALAQDPAGYAVAASPDVQKALAAAGDDPAAIRRAQALIGETQARLGVPEHLRRALPNGQAKALAQRITGVAPEQAANLLQGTAELYGDAWPAVYRDLVRADLPPTYRVLAETDDPVARKELATALQSEQTEKGALRRGLANADAQAIDESLMEELADFRLSLAASPDGAVAADRYLSSAKLLAYRYAGTGLSASEAAKRAANDLVNKKYAFVQDDRHNARVPPALEDNARETAARILSGLKASDLPDPGGAPDLTPERRREIALSAIKRGTWVTNETDDGWLLLDVNGQPVNRADGARVQFRFMDAAPTTADMPEAWRPEGAGMERNVKTGELRRVQTGKSGTVTVE